MRHLTILAAIGLLFMTAMPAAAQGQVKKFEVEPSLGLGMPLYVPRTGGQIQPRIRPRLHRLRAEHFRRFQTPRFFRKQLHSQLPQDGVAIRDFRLLLQLGRESFALRGRRCRTGAESDHHIRQRIRLRPHAPQSCRRRSHAPHRSRVLEPPQADHRRPPDAQRLQHRRIPDRLRLRRRKETIVGIIPYLCPVHRSPETDSGG